MLDRDVVRFYIGFTGIVRIRGLEIALALAMLETLYDSDTISLREITSAQIQVGRAKVQSAAYQVLFTEV